MEIKPFIKQTDEGVMEFFEHSGGMLLESRGVNRVYNRKRIVASNPALRIRGSGEYFVIESESKLGNKLLTLFSEDDFYYAAELEKTETSLTGKVKRNFDPNVDEHERVKMPHTGTAIQTIIDKFEKYLGADDYLGLFGAIAYDFARNFYDVGERFSEGSDDFNLMLPSKLLIIDKDKAKHEIHYLEVDGEIDDRSIPLDKTFIQSEEKYFEDMSLEDYKEKVGEILEDINNGRLMQCVLSRIEGHRLQRHPFESYQKLRDANPSPYSFFYDIGDGTALYGASPEINIGINDRLIEIRPIAGTVKRSDNPVEDLRLKQQLLSDPKERAEHTMLIDLARNDINRICHAQSVHEPDTMIVEEYPNLYHMVSSVRGVLKNEFNAIDALVTTLPQGTLSGSPKREAMIALENLEESRRGYYGGAVGYINFNGYCNTGIVIRSVYVEKGMSFVRSGAGIVADSLPENEANEIQLKAEKATVVLRGE